MLLVALGVLALLVAFAVAFFALVNLERRASQNYTDTVRATFVAKAGLERAKTELRELAGKRAYSWIYPLAIPPAARSATKPFLTATPPSDETGADPWGYAWSQPAGFLPSEKPTLANTNTPSFWMVDPTRTIAGHAGRLFVYSGLMGATYPKGADAYRLKIVDCAAQINLNHPDRASLQRMLRNLIKARFSTASAAGPAVSDADALWMAQNVCEMRPSSGYGAKNDVFSILPVQAEQGGTLTTGSHHPLTQDQWLALRDDLTVQSWVDKKVIRPPGLNDAADLTPQDVDSKGASLAQPIVRGFQMSARSPVNLNTASPYVLTALFAELRAHGTSGDFQIDFTNAKLIADAICSYRGGPCPPAKTTTTGSFTPRPFRTWEEFGTFVDSMNTYLGPLNESISLSQGQRDLVKAMMNPNSDIVKCGSEQNLGGLSQLDNPVGSVNAGCHIVDKSDIVRGTTEGCFDAMGIYEITSLGQLFNSDLEVIAEQSIMQIVKVYDVFRLTTQQDFEQNRTFGYPGNFLAMLKNDPFTDPHTPGQNWRGLDKTISSAFTPPGYSTLTAGQPFSGFPGLLSYPQYSLVRKPDNGTATGSEWAPDSNYEMASWDGYLALSNLQGFATMTPDFVADFARGQIMALKCRGWWDPRDQDLTTGNSMLAPYDDTNAPTHPIAGETDAMCAPIGGAASAPRTSPLSAALTTVPPGGQKPTATSIIDDTFDNSSNPGTKVNTVADALAMFRDGSALTNSGVRISPDRVIDGTQNPRLLCYDGRNLELNPTGCSIRFWVQPQLDPDVRPKEVLFSWAGSQRKPAAPWNETDQTAGNDREVGFVVYKQSHNGQTQIVLEAYQGPNGWKTDNTFAPDPWTSNWVDPGNNVGSLISIDVDNWAAHTWHWVAIDFGGCGSWDARSAISIHMSVDGKPQLHDSAGANPQKLYFYGHGVNPPSRTSPGNGGVIHGHYDNFWTGDLEPLNANNAVNQKGVFVWWAPTKWWFGHYYCCDDPDATGGGSPNTKHHTLLFKNAVAYDGTTYSPTGPQSLTDDDGHPHQWPSAPFNPQDYDQQITLKFSSITGQNPNNVTPPNPVQMTQDPNGKWKHDFAPAEYGPDSVPGGQEWQIDVQLDWDTAQAAGGNKCQECMYPSGQTDPTGNHLTCNEDSRGGGDPSPNGTNSEHFPFEYHASDGKHCWFIPPNGYGIFHVPAPFGWQIDKQHYCDDCHGCGSCSVRGPMWFGGEPAGQKNFTSGTTSGSFAPAPGDASTCADAIFDNIIIANGSDQHRIDCPGNTVEASPENRFFEQNLTRFLSAHGTEGTADFGSRYDRALSELFGTTFKLGTLSWTAYSAPGLSFSLGLYRAPAIGPAPSYANALRAGGPQFTTTAPWTKVIDNFSSNVADRTILMDSDPARANAPYGYYEDGGTGIRFGSGTVVQGNEIPPGTGTTSGPTPQLLVLSVMLNAASGLPEGRTLSPILDDVTLTTVNDVPVVLYTEEGVEE